VSRTAFLKTTLELTLFLVGEQAPDEGLKLLVRKRRETREPSLQALQLTLRHRVEVDPLEAHSAGVPLARGYPLPAPPNVSTGAIDLLPIQQDVADHPFAAHHAKARCRADRFTWAG
jgi:hypothetical protein